MSAAHLITALMAAGSLTSLAHAGWIFVPCEYSIGSWQSGYVPDFDQIREQGPLQFDGQNYFFDPPGLPNKGFMHCAPAAATNWLAWLANHGYPALMPFSDAPTNWAHPSIYDEVTATISEVGLEMGTSATDGTSNMHTGLDAWIVDHVGAGKFQVGSVGSSGSSAPSLSDIGGAGASGKLVIPVIGWYEEVSNNHWQRNGGHVVTLTGAFNYCSLTDAEIRFRDPASDYSAYDPEYMTQSAFANETYPIEYVQAHFRKKAGDPWNVRTHARVLGGYATDYPLGELVPFIDGYVYITPQMGVAPGPGETIVFGNPYAPSVPGNPVDSFASVNVGVQVSLLVPTPTLDAVFLLGTDNVLYRFDTASFEVEPLFPAAPGPQIKQIEMDGAGRLYSLRGFYVQQEGDGGGPAWSLPGPGDDFAWDENSGHLFVLSAQLNAVFGFDTSASGIPAPTFYQLPPTVYDGQPHLVAHGGMLWIGSQHSPELRSYLIEPGAALLPMQTFFIGELPGMSGLEIGDGPIAYVTRHGAVTELDLSSGTPQPITGGFGDTLAAVNASGPFVLLDARRLFEDDQLLEPRLPTQFGPSTPDTCAGDVNQDGVVDALDFLALLSAWGPNPGHPADFNGDDIVDALDFLELIAAWGPCLSV